MDLQRPHRSTSINNSSSSTSTTSELFICFTAGLSSSSMKNSSKLILSPGHTREPSQISVSSSSLTRRLRTNGSMKGGQASPMFPTNGKKRGSAFENPEPSSPKVTCIGQVRVKTKKQGKKFRACTSKRRGEVSLRKVDHNNNNGSNNGLDSSIHLLRNSSQCHHHNQQQECKRWVHLPVTICEALRGFGAEFNCFLPCRSSCMANQRDKEEKTGGSARWLVVSGEDDVERRGSGEMMMMMRSSRRRHVFEDIEINDFANENLGNDGEEEKEEKGRVSICIPPKNALLLMRCRSDPAKMAALANKFWETPLPQDIEEQQEQQEAEIESEESKVQDDAVEVEFEHQEVSEASEMFVTCEASEEQEIPEGEAETEAESVFVRDETEVIEEESLGKSLKEERTIECQEQETEVVVVVEEEEKDQQESTIKEETLPQVSSDLDKLQVEENVSENEELQQEEAEDGNENVSVKAEEEGEEDQAVVVEEEETEETHGRSEMREPDPDESKESESQEKLLPDCLLLMMCEPKLSMEVSKETWVCSTDFIRCVPEKKKEKVSEVKQKDGGDQSKTRISIDRNPPAPPILLQPRRSSCCFPVAPPMATAVAAAARGAGGGGGSLATTMIEKKLVGGKGYEPFALSRCKSEPRRSSAKLAPDTCFWNNRKLEPATVGLGAAGVGF